jgi:hypothetical protein
MRCGRFVVLLALIAARPARASVPSSFTVQGVLRDSTGKLQSMPVQVAVNLYGAQSGSAPLASYAPAMVTASNGLFTLTITDASLVTEVSSASGVWLELITCPPAATSCDSSTPGSDTFARQPVTSELFALMCGHADDAAALGGQPASAYLTTSAAGSTYATQASLASYATQSSLSSYLTTAQASSTYETQSAAAAAFQPKGSYQAPLSTTACPSGQAYAGIAANGAATCTGTVASATSATSFTGALAGDVSGTQGATKVSSLAGVALSTAAPASGQVLKYNGAQWAAAPDANSGGTVTSVTASAPLSVTSGTTTPNISLGVVPVASGGTGRSDGTNLIGAWGLIKVSTAGVITIINGYNIASVGNGGSFISINFATALRSGNYAVLLQDGRPDDGGFPTALVYNPDFYSGDRFAGGFLLRQDSISNWSAPPRELTFSVLVVGG